VIRNNNPLSRKGLAGGNNPGQSTHRGSHIGGSVEQAVKELRDRPLDWSYFAFPWGEEGTHLEMSDGPREWQDEINGYIQQQLDDPNTRHNPIRIAVRSGHGIGKSAEVGILTNWGMSTCVDARIVITANTDGQLRSKTSPEVGKWFNMSVTSNAFDKEVSIIRSKLKDHAQNWKLEYIPWSERNPEAFQGLHNLYKRIIVVMDEASAIPDIIWETIEGALTDEHTQIIWIAFGNPTRNNGRFAECWGKHRKLWKTWSIDSRTVPGTNKELIQQWEDTYGADSDFFKVRVRGLPPRVSTMQLIGTDLVERAKENTAQSFIVDPVIWGLDIARFGDDRTVLAIRQGFDARTHKMFAFDNVSTPDLVGWLGEKINSEHPDAVFIDMGNTGGAVFDLLQKLGHDCVIPVWFGSKPDGDIDGIRVLNKRTEMYLRARSWLQNPMAAIPHTQELTDDLINVQYGYYGDQVTMMLEKKDDMKARGLASPDFGDAFALTFAYAVQPKNKIAKHLRERAGAQHIEQIKTDYDRYADQ